MSRRTEVITDTAGSNILPNLKKEVELMKDQSFYTPEELAIGVKLIIEKNRDTLSVTETNLLEDVLVNLKNIDKSDKKILRYCQLIQFRN